MTQKVLGDSAARKEAGLVTLAMLVITTLYAGGLHFFADYTINWLEFLGTWFVSTAVWLVRTRNIWTWPIGTIGTIAYGLFFFTIAIPGQAFLNLIFFSGIQLLSWLAWIRSKDDGEPLLKVKYLSNLGRVGWTALTAALVGVVYFFIDTFSPGSQFPIMDAIVVGASLTGQALLMLKKVESWWLWLGPVNTLSIILFAMSGAYVVLGLYIAFFIHAAIAIRTWHKAQGKA